MANRKRGKKQQSGVRRKLIGILFLVISAVLFAGMVLVGRGAGGNESIGVAGGYLSRSLIGFFGRGGLFVPVLGMVFGIRLFFNFRDETIRLNVAGFFVLLLGALGLMSLDEVAGTGFSQAVRDGSNGAGGGIVGMASGWVLVRAFGRWGAAIILAGVVLAGLVLALEGVHFLDLRSRLARYRRGIRERKAGKEESRRTRPGDTRTPPVRSGESPGELPRADGPRIRRPDASGDATYESVRDLLMDENIGRPGRSRPGASSPSKPAGPPEDRELQQQMEMGLAPEKAAPAQYRSWQYPPLTLLRDPPGGDPAAEEKEIQETARVLEDTLESFGVKLKIDEVSIGPSITRYEARLAPGVKVSKIVRLGDDIALSLAAPSIRIEAPIPGKAAIGIEVPNKTVTEVGIREILSDPAFQVQKGSLTVALGKDLGGRIVTADLVRMPHLLVAGATGSGKSVCMNTIITSLLFRYRPDELKLLMIDPKKVELSVFNEVPHLVAPVIGEPRRAAAALKWMTSEMENRYSLFAEEGVKDIYTYNRKVLEQRRKGDSETARLPVIAIFIDELADLMMVSPAEVEDSICRLAQLARGAGMHLVVATQRPSVNVITGLIKANIPSRIAFAVSSQVDSRTILDSPGAEKLLGRGDMLFSPVGLSKPRRLQGALISDREVRRVVDFLREQGKPEYQKGIEDLDPGSAGDHPGDEGGEDELLAEAGALVIETGQASISMIQRRLRVGYTRAARIIDQLEERGIVGGYEGAKARRVLVGREEFQRLFEGGTADAEPGD